MRRHDPDDLRRVDQEHEQVLGAVAAGDADAARAAMRVHLVNGRKRIRTAFDHAVDARPRLYDVRPPGRRTPHADAT